MRGGAIRAILARHVEACTLRPRLRCSLRAARAESVVAADCTLKGLTLYGDVEIVDSFPDLRVQIVDSFPDLRVKKVDAFADSCGAWRIVESFPDLKIQLVDSFPDLKIMWVESFPGLP